MGSKPKGSSTAKDNYAYKFFSKSYDSHDLIIDDLNAEKNHFS
jgi:hypothetical protein